MTTNSVPLIVRRIISSSPQQIFDAFSDPAALSQWFRPSLEIDIEVLEFEFVVAGRFRFRYTMGDGRRSVVGGVYEEISSPNRIVVTWIWETPDALADIPMHVTFDFIGLSDATEVVVTHEGIPSDQACTIHQDGWEGTFNQLEQLLELRQLA